MKTKLLTYFFHTAVLLAVGALSVISCMKQEIEPAPEVVVGDEVLVDLEFCSPASEAVSIGTKASMSDYFENQVKNIYLIIFDASGKRRYIHFFSDSNLKTDEAAFNSAVLDCWWVEQKQVGKVAQTHGKIRIRVNQMAGARLYAVANINGAFVNVTPERLNIVGTEDAYKQLAATMLQEQAFRNNSMFMTGYSGIDITEKDVTLDNTYNDKKLHLIRLDAKVNVKVRTATGYESKDGESRSKLKEFIPATIEIFNLPRGCAIVDAAGDDPDFVENLGYFNMEPAPFETAVKETFTLGGESYDSDVHGFVFYMLENKHSAKTSPGSVQNRELRAKDKATGKYLTDTDPDAALWEYAPEAGTYLRIKGEVIMDVNVSADAKTQALNGEVTYLVHLGSFGTNPADFNVLRNHEYTYTVTVKGVNKIEVEVTDSYTADGSINPAPREDNPGAFGHVNVAKEAVYTFDAHYGQRLFTFDAENIDAENISWYVKSPFGLEGIPSRDENGILNAAPYDYKWVHFMKSRQEKDLDESYDRLNEAYPGDTDDRLMDVIQFTDYIVAQKRKFDENKANNVTPVNSGTDFRPEYEEWESLNGPKKELRYKLYITVFVDEYYYDRNPVDGTPADLSLWKQFVNQENRVMYILCDSRVSTDGDSNSTGSVITIKQKSIQTPYAVREGVDIERAWGTESVDETRRSLFFFSPDEKFSNKSTPTEDGTSYGNEPDGSGSVTGFDSPSNGLYNQAVLLGMDALKNGQLKWDSYLDYIRPNDYNKDNYNCVFLNDEHMAGRYACLMRNRDNNGNGVIDPEEVRWYLGAVNQMYDLYIGEMGLSAEARLYDPAYSTLGNDYVFGSGNYKQEGWRNHVVTSTEYIKDGKLTKQPSKIWTEQGVSISAYNESWEARPVFDYRCVRNLGIPDATKETIGNKNEESEIPESIVSMKSAGTGADAVYSFDLRKLNRASVRFYVTNELEPGDENSYQSRAYYGFQTGAAVDMGSSYDYNNLKTDLENGKTNCPAGYRVPNIREATIIKQLIAYNSNTDWWNAANRMMSSSYSSLGTYGNKRFPSKWGWNIIGSENINMSTNDVSHSIRCVRDLSLDEISAIFD